MADHLPGCRYGDRGGGRYGAHRQIFQSRHREKSNLPDWSRSHRHHEFRSRRTSRTGTTREIAAIARFAHWRSASQVGRRATTHGRRQGNRQAIFDECSRPTPRHSLSARGCREVRCPQFLADRRTRWSSEREPADSLRDKSHVIGGWLPSLTFAFGIDRRLDALRGTT